MTNTTTYNIDNVSKEVTGSIKYLSENSAYTIVQSTYSLHIAVKNPVAELLFPFSGYIVIQLNKKLNWFQHLCYNALGFEQSYFSQSHSDGVG